MQTQAERRGTAAHARPRGRNIWRTPVVTSVVFGFYAGFLDQEGGASLGRAWLLGILAGVALLALWLAVHSVRTKMIREVRSAAYGALAGSAIGFLVGLSGAAVLKASAIGFFVGLGMMIAVNYRLYGRVR
ncbi:hypothetical protein [Streptomyces xinghaiensis]|uniref:hypothetical protein n=1 Tax=Streptomyces xinghaiensis TaxID=1038928 RepID=UPI0002E4C9D1|nr:hypothetical protein [Streptomyces xinghaiensis]MZE79548.1 hypothetical protein [Streptomyces sp. SID5475]